MDDSRKFNPQSILDKVEQLRNERDYWHNEAIRMAAELGEIKITQAENTCDYKLVDDDVNLYVCSKCGEPWMLNEGTPKDNNMNYCTKCGSRIIYEEE